LADRNVAKAVSSYWNCQEPCGEGFQNYDGCKRGGVELHSYVSNSPCDGAETFVVTDLLLPLTDIAG
jgi:hypothetical protein